MILTTFLGMNASYNLLSIGIKATHACAAAPGIFSTLIHYLDVKGAKRREL